MAELRSEIGELWFKVNKEMHERFRSAFKGADLPPITMILLRHVSHEPGVTVSELARRSGTVKSHVSKMIDQLVQQGDVEKRPDPDDQRLLRVYTTPSGAAKMADMHAKVHQLWSEAIADLPEPQLEEVARGLRILLDTLKKPSEE